jgi:hypothetical protein
MEWYNLRDKNINKTLFINIATILKGKRTCKKFRPGRHLSRARNFVVGPFSPCWMIAGNRQCKCAENQ